MNRASKTLRDLRVAEVVKLDMQLDETGAVEAYRAKELGKARCEVFDDSMRQSAIERLELEDGLRGALDRRELVLHYQPQVDLDNGRIAGMEALLRWQHPRLGPVAPSVFIPLAEETGLIHEIGIWVLRSACRQNKALQDAKIANVLMKQGIIARPLMPAECKRFVITESEKFAKVIEQAKIKPEG